MGRIFEENTDALARLERALTTQMAIPQKTFGQFMRLQNIDR
jgi:hypothetical protein